MSEKNRPNVFNFYSHSNLFDLHNIFICFILSCVVLIQSNCMSRIDYLDHDMWSERETHENISSLQKSKQ